MRRRLVACVVLILCSSTLPQGQKVAPAIPNQFDIGRHTFFDFGPPSDFYEVFLVRTTTAGSSIERITLTPAADECFVPAKLEIASASVSESPAVLLGSTSPCTIPEKELRRELKRCKHCLVFSGAHVVMQAQCGGQTRLIRSDVLDRDMFDRAPNTPPRTSWTMQLLDRLDRAVGPGVMEKPIFPIPGKEEPSAKNSDSETLRDLGAGKYDALFQGAPDKPSDLYRASRKDPPPPPSARLVSSLPIPPEVFVLPKYPPIARMAHIEGAVSFKTEVDADGTATNVTFESGHPMLRPSVKEAVGSWRFPRASTKQEIHATIEFALNCPARAK